MHIATALAGFTAADIGSCPSPGTITAQVRAAVYARPASTHCHYCDLVLAPRRWRGPTPKGTLPGQWRTLDHVVPRRRGGTGAAANLVASCFHCNKAKGDLPLADFLASPALATRRAVVARHRARAATRAA